MNMHLSNSQTPSTSPIPWICRRPVRIVLYSLLGAFVLWMVGWGIVPRLLDPTGEQHVEDKAVMVGMTREQVMKAWGGPYQMNVSYTEKASDGKNGYMRTGLIPRPLHTGIYTLKRGNCWADGTKGLDFSSVTSTQFHFQGVSVICIRRTFPVPPPEIMMTRFHSLI